MSSEKITEATEPTENSKYLRQGIDNPYFHPVSKRFRRLPPWLDHFNAKDLKTLFKCWAAVWIYTLFIVINPLLKAVGQAVFFGAIVLFIAPPSGVVFIGLLAGTTLLLGVCLGWAWGTITMKAALATRPAADLNARLAELQAEATRDTLYVQQASGQTSYAQIAIFDGFMLDARVSVTYFCMIGLFIYFMARLRVKVPKLALTVVFATVISDIYLTIAPLIPTFTGTIPQTLIKPAAIAVGIGFVCNILFFPRSTSHIVLDSMQDFLAPMGTFLEACVMHFQDPGNHMDLGRLTQTKAQTVGAFKAIQGSLGFLALEASMGRWSAQDVSSLHEPLRRVLITFVGLLQVQIGRREFLIKDEKLLTMAESLGHGKPDDGKAGHHQITRTFDFRQRAKHPDGDRLRDESLKALAVSGEDILNVCQDSVVAIRESLRNCNTRRWFKRPSEQECAENYKKHATTLDQLRKHKQEFANRTAEHLWKPHDHLFDDDGHLISKSGNGMPPAGGVMLALVFEERIFNLADALDTLLSRVVTLEHDRTKSRLWLPAGLQKLFSWVIKDDDAISEDMSNSMSSEIPESEKVPERKKPFRKQHETDAEKTKTAATQLANMRAHGGVQRSKSSGFIIGVIHWLTNTEGLFALRMLIVTVALGVIAVIPSSAGFFYREKGLWAMIMAQTGLMPYTSDFVFGFLVRITGTVIGAVVGLLCWYIGAGTGPGNPYGIAAIMAVVIVILMWFRLFLPPATLQGVILATATCYLVVGYSWADTHIPSYGNPGVGCSVFWRRMLLVLIGFFAGAIVTFFPRPPSASRHYRRLLSESLGTTKNQYALFVLNCKEPLPDLLQVTEKTAIATGELLNGIEPTIQLTKLEFSTSSFDAATLSLICHLCMNLNQAVTQLLLYAPHLPEQLKTRFIRVTGVLEEQLIGDVMAVLTLIQQALKTGDPLPLILPVPLLARSAESLRNRVTEDEAHGVSFNKQMLAEEGVRKYCSAMAAFVQFLSAIDELVIVVKRAVGETSYMDLERQ